MSESIDGSVPKENWDFWIDVGGTFTDCVARGPSGENKRFKLLSTGVIRGEARVVSPRCLTAKLRNTDSIAWSGYQCRVIAATGDEWTTVVTRSTPDSLELSDPLPISVDDSVSIELFSSEPAPIVAIRCLLEIPLQQDLPPLQLRLGTTRGTNALLTRTGARVGLLLTEGFGDLLTIGNQDRPRLFELSIQKPTPLYHCVAEVLERVDCEGNVIQLSG